MHQKKHLIHEQIRSKATMNIYKKTYGIPEDLMVRKPDQEIRSAMKNSVTLDKVRMMAENSIHPSLIFFEKDLPDRMVEIAVKKLHANDRESTDKIAGQFISFKETNTLLSAGSP